MNLSEKLASLDKDFNTDINLLGCEFFSAGYHSKVPSGTWAHPTVTNMNYALALLEINNAERAEKIIRAVISTQETDPYRDTFGIFPWLYDEPLDEMAPPDWNWSGFIGSRLCHALIEYSDKLSSDIIPLIKESLERAAWAIFRRNMNPGYTNIALMGATVTSTAGEILNQKLLVEYGKSRFETFYNYTVDTGGFNEYNSPCYSFIALEEIERTLQLVKNPEIRETAKKIHKLLWKTISEHFHPTTGQLAGPHSRSYTEMLTPRQSKMLTELTKEKIFIPKNSKERDNEFSYNPVKHLPCPKEFCERFVKLPKEEIEQKDRFIKGNEEKRSIYGTTYICDDLSFGTVNHGSFWTQTRPLLGYWALPNNEVAVFRLRLLHNGVDFASGFMQATQDKNRALVTIGTLKNHGDFHAHLDAPKDKIFHLTNLTLRYELQASEAKSQKLSDNCFELSAGNYKVIIHTSDGVFGSNKVYWQSGSNDGKAWIEAVLIKENTPIEFTDDFKTDIGTAVEVIQKGSTYSKNSIKKVFNNTKTTYSWNELNNIIKNISE